MNYYRGGKPRPTYERYKNTEDERRAKEVIDRAWNCCLEKTRQFAHFDWTARRDGKLAALIEFKCRTNAKGKYPTYMISKRKWDALKEQSIILGVPALLVVQWTDQLGYVAASKDTPVQISTGGRVDRGDPMDVESVALIDINQFKRIPNASS